MSFSWRRKIHNRRRESCHEKFKLSLSRLFYAKKFANYKQVTIDFVCGNMFSLPYEGNSVDAVLLMHEKMNCSKCQTIITTSD